MIASFVSSTAVTSTHDRSTFFNLKKSKPTDLIEKKVELFAEQRQFSSERNEDIVEEILKRVLLFSAMRLLEESRLKTDVQLLRAFNAAAAFISDTENYPAATCACVKISSVLRYKINNTRLKMNKLMLMIAELKRLHEKIDNKIYLTH